MAAAAKKITGWQLAAVCFCLTTVWLSIQLKVSSNSPTVVQTNTKPKGVKEFTQTEYSDKITLLMSTHFDDVPRFLGGLASLRLNMPAWAVHEMILVTPYAESLVLPALVRPPHDYELSWPIRVMADHEVLGVSLNDLMSQPDFEHTYFKFKLQMALKLFVCMHVETEFYLVLDSDVMMMQPLQTLRWLLPENTVAFYKPEARYVHSDWWNSTESYLNLGGCLPADGKTPTFGVTPAILSRSIAEKVLTQIYETFGIEPKNWMPALFATDRPLWTEYTAFRLVACKQGVFDQYHRPELADGETPVLYTGCWTKESTFNNTIRAPENSLFLVVQSSTQVPMRKVVQDLMHVCQW